MKKLKLTGLAGLLFCLCILVGISLPLRNQGEGQKRGQQPNFEKFPTVDYQSAEQVDPAEKEKRAKRAKKHNIKYAPRIDQLTRATFLINDWDVDLPALPVARSQAVIIGRVKKAEAQLSEDRTGVFSEFTVTVETILKNDVKTPLTEDKSIVLLRLGGRVRLPSGQIIVSGVSHQDMPQVGSKYVLFLEHNSPHGGDVEDFYILTGYELKDDKAFPLDTVSSFHPINRYNGVSETKLLTDLSNALSSK